MASKQFIEGIQYAIDLFEPAVMRTAGMLDEAHNSISTRTELRNNLRASFRAFGEVVGGLKMKRDEFAGLEWQHRFVVHSEYEAAVVEAGDLGRKLVTAKPSERPELAEQVEHAERFADAKMLDFALKDNGKFPDAR